MKSGPFGFPTKYMNGSAEDDLNESGGGWERTISVLNTAFSYVNVIGEKSYT